MILYKNALYQGQSQNNLRHGYGICWWFNGSIYIGEWQDDQIHGDGFLFDNGSSYKAQFKNNKIHGYCLNEGSYLNYQFGWLNGTNIINDQSIEFYRGEQKISKNNQSIEEIKGINLEIQDQYTNGLLDFTEISERNQYYKIDQVNDYLGFQHGIGISLFHKQHYMIGIVNESSMKLCQYQRGDDYFTGHMKNGTFEGHGIYYISSKSKMIEGLFKDGKCIQILEIHEGDKQIYQNISLKIILNHLESLNLKTYQQRVQMPFYQKPQIVVEQTHRESSKSTPAYVKQVHFSIDELQTFRDTSESNRHSIQPAKSIVDLNNEDKSPLKEKSKNEKLEVTPINLCKRDKEINPQSHRLPVKAICNKVKTIISVKRIK